MKSALNFLITIGCLLLFIPAGVGATGVRPASTILIISEADLQADMSVENTDDSPALLTVKIIDLPEDMGITVFALPEQARIEAGGSQIVRFILQQPDTPLKVQSLKRVSFEGIPGKKIKSAKDAGNNISKVSFTVRQNIPMVISPIGLQQDDEPWKFIEAKILDAQHIEISNPSPFVVRLSSEVLIAPSLQKSQLQTRTYILPGEKFKVSFADITTADALTVMRIYPASPWGLAAPPYDIRITH